MTQAGGYPREVADLSDASKAIYDDVRDALIFVSPLITSVLFQDSKRDVSGAYGAAAPVNRLSHQRVPVRPGDGAQGGPNMDVMYSFATLRLGEDALLFHKPETDRFYTFLVLSAHGDLVTVIGSGENAPHSAGDVLLTGPKFREPSLPRDEFRELRRIKVPTCIANGLLRIGVEGNDGVKVVHRLQDETTLSEVGEKSEPAPAPTGRPPFVAYRRKRSMGIEGLFNIANAALVDNPPLMQDAAYLAKFERYGVGAGLVFALDIFHDEALVELLRLLPEKVFDELGGTSSSEDDRSRGFERGSRTGSGSGYAFDARRARVWEAFGDGTRCRGDYFLRAHSAHWGVGANPPEASLYYYAATDADGNPLDGSHRYRVHFEANDIPTVRVDGYWSITPYTKGGMFLLENPYGAYEAGSKTGLRLNDDGGVDLYLQAEPPSDAGFHGNWAAVGAGEFMTIFRVYVPSEETLAGHWLPPAIERVD